MLSNYSWGDFAVAVIAVFIVYYAIIYVKFYYPYGTAGQTSKIPTIDQVQESDRLDNDMHADEFIRKPNNKSLNIKNFDKFEDREASPPIALDFDEGFFEEEEEEISAEEIMSSSALQKLADDMSLQEERVGEEEHMVFSNFATEALDEDNADVEVGDIDLGDDKDPLYVGEQELPLAEMEEREELLGEQPQPDEGFDFGRYLAQDTEQTELEPNIDKDKKGEQYNPVEEKDEDKDSFDFSKYID